MTTLDDIERAVERLSADKLAEFRAWFEIFDAAQFDAKLDRDMSGGKLDQLAEEAIRDFHAGRAKEL